MSNARTKRTIVRTLKSGRESVDFLALAEAIHFGTLSEDDRIRVEAIMPNLVEAIRKKDLEGQLESGMAVQGEEATLP